MLTISGRNDLLKGLPEFAYVVHYTNGDIFHFSKVGVAVTQAIPLIGIFYRLSRRKEQVFHFEIFFPEKLRNFHYPWPNSTFMYFCSKITAL